MYIIILLQYAVWSCHLVLAWRSWAKESVVSGIHKVVSLGQDQDHVTLQEMTLNLDKYHKSSVMYLFSCDYICEAGYTV